MRSAGRDQRGELTDLTWQPSTGHIPSALVPEDMRAYLRWFSDTAQGYEPTIATVALFYTPAGMVRYQECSERTDTSLWLAEHRDEQEDRPVWVQRSMVHVPRMAQRLLLGWSVAWGLGLMLLCLAVMTDMSAMTVGIVLVFTVVMVCVVGAATFARMVSSGSMVDDSVWHCVDQTQWHGGLSLVEWLWSNGYGPEDAVAELDHVLAQASTQTRS